MFCSEKEFEKKRSHEEPVMSRLSDPSRREYPSNRQNDQ